MLTYVQNIKSKNTKIQIMKKRHFQNQTTHSKLDAMFSNPPESCPRRIPSEMIQIQTWTHTNRQTHLTPDTSYIFSLHNKTRNA